jgi:aspartate/methionine/tyrosine aminotransferase
VHFPRMPIEEESPEQLGYDLVKFNLTESSVRDRSLAELGLDLGALTLCYTDHLGRADLRALIAARAGGALKADDVLVTAGAAAALFIIAITLLDAGEHMIVVRPNYATNIETPKALRCQIDYLDLNFENAFALDLDALAKLIRPTTRLISLTTPHNPTGVSLTAAQLTQVLELADRCGAHVLVDETYRDMSFAPPPPVAATLSPRAISVSSLSKSYGIPGIRTGWIANADPALMRRFLCAKEQIGICGSVLDEAAAFAALTSADTWLADNGPHLRAAFAAVQAWMAAEPLLEWVAPTGGCVCFPRIREDAGVDTAAFYRALNHDHGAYVGPGHWFDQSDRFFRIGYGWPTPAELAGGLAAVSASLRAARR